MTVVDTPSTLVDTSLKIDNRGSWIPTWSMISTRILELRKRRGLMVALVVVNIGLPVLFLTIRLLAHALDPKSYGPAGGYSIYGALVAGVMYNFGFIVAATLGCTAGSVDLTEGMFRHLVVTGRSRLALYFARIPAGLAIVCSLVAVGFSVVCVVCCLAAPTHLNYNGVDVPQGLSKSGLETWAVSHESLVDCNFGFEFKSGPGGIPNIPCTNSRGVSTIVPQGQVPPGTQYPTPSQIRAFALQVADQNYLSYSQQFLTPSISLMIRSGLWLELVAAMGLLVGLGLSSLMGQRTVPVILMIVLQIILTPIFATNVIPYMINAQRALVGLAMLHMEPSSLPLNIAGGRGNGGASLISETHWVAALVIVGWAVVWTSLGAWRMAKRDA
jgi:hypothetical protein